MGDYEECKFYTNDRKCSHRDAPKPYESECIGKDNCGAWEDHIDNQAKRD